jgi:signal transduction histidine kinase
MQPSTIFPDKSVNEAPLAVRILLVEDDEDDYLIIRDYLSDTFLKYEITWANNYELFVSNLNNFQFDLVVTDYLLGRVSGIEVLRKVKEKNPFIPVIMLTGKGNNAIDMEAMKMGAADYLLKGNFDSASIERSVRYALERANSARILQENESYQNTLNKIVSTGRIARMIAHEVKNPLTNITLCINQLQSELTGNEELLSYLDIIYRNTTRINQLVVNLLDSTRFGDIQLEKRNLVKVIQDTIAMAADRVKLKGITVRDAYSHPEIELELDEEKMKIGILNILINAVEALEENQGVIEVKVIRDKKYIRIHVKDNGPGMTTETREKLFEPFFTSKPSGSGLGLTSTQNIVLSHKGKIEVRSEPGKGCEFVITFPVSG